MFYHFKIITKNCQKNKRQDEIQIFVGGKLHQLNDNQYFKWDVLDKISAADSTWMSFSNENDFAKTVMDVTFFEGNPNVRFVVKTEFAADYQIARYSLLLPFKGDDFVVYRANNHVDLNNCQDELFIDFIRFLLQIDPNERPCAAEAMEHPWMKFKYEE